MHRIMTFLLEFVFRPKLHLNPALLATRVDASKDMSTDSIYVAFAACFHDSKFYVLSTPHSISLRFNIKNRWFSILGENYILASESELIYFWPKSQDLTWAKMKQLYSIIIIVLYRIDIIAIFEKPSIDRGSLCEKSFCICQVLAQAKMLTPAKELIKFFGP